MHSVVAVLFSLFKPSLEPIISRASDAGRRIVMLFFLGLVTSVLFSAGLFLALTEATRQYDEAGIVTQSMTLSAGVVLAMFCLMIFGLAFYMGWPKSAEMKPVANAQRAPALEEALSLLILDYIQERETKRQSAETAMNTVTSEDPDFVRPEEVKISGKVAS